MLARMRWTVHSEKPLYTDPWLDIRVADVELPDGRHLEHRLVWTPPGAGAVISDGNGRVLLLWRHRFITGTWGWEIPIGKADPGEDPAATAAHEIEEEAGWRSGPLRLLLRVEPPRESPTRRTTSTAPIPRRGSGRPRTTSSPAV
jgi:8-oxo-dGTP pyrophosphatase MutT (NUDIX family)